MDLYDAIQRSDASAAQRILQKDPQLANSRIGFGLGGWNPLQYALSKGNSAVIMTLMEFGGRQWLSEDDSFGVLEAAAHYGRIDAARLLLEHGGRPDGGSVGISTPLISASLGGYLEVARLLVEAGADVDRDSLARPDTPLGFAEDPPPNTDGRHAKVAEYLRSAGATKPWDYHRPETFWDGVVGELTILFAESCLGLTHAQPVGERKTEHATIHIRRARHGWKTIFQTLYSAGLPTQGGHCEVGLCLTSKWPLHRRALEEDRFRRPVDFLMAVSDRILQGAPLAHGDLLGRDHELVRGLEWPGDFDQWVAVRHDSFEARRAEIGDAALPSVLLLVPHLGKRPLKTAKEALAIADAKAKVKWEKPAASGAKNNLVVPLCYDAPWLNGRWY